MSCPWLWAGREIVDPTLLRVLLVVIAYVSGSVPFSVVVARITGGPDPRTIGSGKTGGTNTLRALGRRWAALVVTGDLAKGALPVLLARILTGGDSAVEGLCAAAGGGGRSPSLLPPVGGGAGGCPRRPISPGPRPGLRSSGWRMPTTSTGSCTVTSASSILGCSAVP